MAKWTDIGAASDYQPGAQACVEADGTPVVVLNIDGQLCVIANNCPHAGLPLGQGELRGKVITCPFHGYTYNVETGRNVDDPDDLPLRTFPIREEGGRVLVDMSPPDPSPTPEE